MLGPLVHVPYSPALAIKGGYACSGQPWRRFTIVHPTPPLSATLPMHPPHACIRPMHPPHPPPRSPTTRQPHHRCPCMQAEADALLQQILTVQGRLRAAEDRQADLHSTRVALSTRLADAASALIAARTATKHAAASHSHALPPADAAARPQGMRTRAPTHTPGSSTCSASSSLHSLQTDASPTEDTRPLPGLRDPLASAPPPIHAYSCAVGISCADLACAFGSPPDFSNQSTARQVKQVCISRARAVGCAAGPAAVCWFVELEHEASPGLPLSLSAALSTPECLASAVLHSVLQRLHLALLTAGVDDSPGEHISAPELKRTRHGRRMFRSSNFQAVLCWLRLCHSSVWWSVVSATVVAAAFLRILFIGEIARVIGWLAVTGACARRRTPVFHQSARVD